MASPPLAVAPALSEAGADGDAKKEGDGATLLVAPLGVAPGVSV